MNQVIQFLQKNPVQYLASIGLDGRPKNRPFMFMLADEGKLWFCTSNEKPVYAQLKKNPYIEICAASADNAWIRIAAKVNFADNRAVKAKIVAASELVKSLYQSAENPTFEVFYLSEGQATIADFSGRPPQEFTL